MKHIFTIAIAVFTLALAAPSAQAQQANATALGQAQSSSQSGSASGASSNNSIVFGSPPADTTATIKNVPSVAAPSLGGGGHPCLQATSGGASILGGSLTGGASRLDPVCMLSFLGQNEAAIRALVANYPKACKALENVGYYLVPMGDGKSTKAVPFRCNDKTVKGGVYTNQVAAARVSTSGPNPTIRPKARPFSKCAKEGNKITFRKASGYTSEVAKAACLSSLGY